MRLTKDEIVARIVCGLEHARKHGRAPGRPKKASDEKILKYIELPTKLAAKKCGLEVRQYIRRRGMLETDAMRFKRLYSMLPTERETKRQIEDAEILALPRGMSNRAAAAKLGMARTTLIRRRRALEELRDEGRR
jgi:hypothetical protein